MTFHDLVKGFLSKLRGGKGKSPAPSPQAEPSASTGAAAVEEYLYFDCWYSDFTSSCIRKFRYDSATSTLTVVFHHGDKEYDYPGTDRTAAAQFAEALSKGTFYNAEVKRGGRGLFAEKKGKRKGTWEGMVSARRASGRR